MVEQGITKILVLLATVLAVTGLLVGCGGDGGETQKGSEELTAPIQKTEIIEETKASRARNAEETTAPAFSVGKSVLDKDEYDATATVTRVVDGDTVDISPAVEGRGRVRLIGVDTPETRDPECGKQPYGDEAKAYTTSKLQGQEVGLEFDVETTDRYDRLLAYLYPRDEEMFNETLLEEGYAQVATFPPNVKYVDRFLAAQQEARTAGRGLWGLSEEELAAQSDRGNGIGGGGCLEEVATQPKATQQPQPKPRPQPQPQPQPAVQPSPQSQPASATPPRGDVDCSDFGSKAEAQAYLLPGDPHRLDRDGDGQACDSLP